MSKTKDKPKKHEIVFRSITKNKDNIIMIALSEPEIRMLRGY
jgi:hypothetical protein